jgi:uncharacterized protein YegL
MKNYVKIINIIDRSGSMGSMIDTAINGFNEFIQEQQTVEGNALVSTVLFSSGMNFYNKLYENIDIKECFLLNKQNYTTGGMTALYDAIGKAIDDEIDQLGSLPKEERPSKTLCVILTDGYENKSEKFNKDSIREKISEMKEDFNWEFIFLAANEEASLTAETMGISKGNSYAFTNSSTGLKDAYMGVSFATRTYRSSKTVSMDNLMDDYRDSSNEESK